MHKDDSNGHKAGSKESGDGQPELPHTVKYTLGGKAILHYECRKCGVRIKSPLTDAGAHDECPNCGTAYVVPGEDELRAETAKNAETVGAFVYADREKSAQDEARMKEARAKILAATQTGTTSTHQPADLPRTQTAYILGGILTVAGVFTTLIAMRMSVTASLSRTVNLELLNTRTNWVTIGCALALGGILMMGIGALGAEVHQMKSRLENDKRK